MSDILIMALGVLTAVWADDRTLDGTWQATSMVVNGFKTPEGEVKNTCLVIGKGEFRQEYSGRVVRSGTVTVDTTRTPHLIDFAFRGDDGKEETLGGVYELSGDRLTACVARPGVPRATALEAKADSGHILTVYERVKP